MTQDIGKLLYQRQISNGSDPTEAQLEVDGRELTKEEKQQALKEYKEKNNLK